MMRLEGHSVDTKRVAAPDIYTPRTVRHPVTSLPQPCTATHPSKPSARASKPPCDQLIFADIPSYFAIGEMHNIDDWREFRPDFTHLHNVRRLLTRNVTWFVCTATLNIDDEEHILDHGGFKDKRRDHPDIC
ncbi:hypothetical protein GGTG_02693 [Gaeumannomyces tritici R3-111a-1]|uniref:Uncharacterized protein n=1 Tax=Gaeumannomyces tritici (strain R3-111a-1) TaxID=644352 RepID=J3NN35_GAET3|nr:hypothetical protein GGTG_02693 [Gaeumannomyces tritici R3-111a-1]EJT77587.1 hypothetical protein GGTG_02693 [Gaeumannomyces tritici R3-111a-1]